MQLLLVAISTLAASVPMIAFLALVWWLDRYEREPVWLVGTAFGWGATIAIALAMFSSSLVAVAVGSSLELMSTAVAADLTHLGESIGPVLIAPLCEEPSKALIVAMIASSRHFDNMTDGFVYGAAAGLGFAMTENFLYFVSVSGDVSTWLGTVLIRTLWSGVMHATATAAFGAGVGWGRWRAWPLLITGGLIGLVLAMGIHGGWNGLLTLDQYTEGNAAFHIDLLLLPILVLATFLVFEACLIEETWTIWRELEEEVATGAVLPGHPRILASWWKRMTSGWLPEGVDKGEYILIATSLAMRKHQDRLLGERAPDWHAGDVERMRGLLRKMLEAARQSTP